MTPILGIRISLTAANMLSTRTLLRIVILAALGLAIGFAAARSRLLAQASQHQMESQLMEPAKQRLFLPVQMVSIPGALGGARYSIDFLLRNAGEVPLGVYDIETSCGCVLPADTAFTLAPHEEILIPIQFTPRREIGDFINVLVLRTVNAELDGLQYRIQGRSTAKLERIVERDTLVVDGKSGHHFQFQLKVTSGKSPIAPLIAVEAVHALAPTEISISGIILEVLPDANGFIIQGEFEMLPTQFQGQAEIKIEIPLRNYDNAIAEYSRYINVE